MLVWFLVPLVIGAVLYAAARPFIVERGRPAIGPTERHGADGEFIQLSQGVTHCKWTGSARGPVAVVVHGIASPMISVNAIGEALGSLGYRVLMYDLYGRGLSDAPSGKQDRAFFLRQLSDLCAYYGLTEELTIAGYSMGGNIATAFATEFPHSVKGIVLVAPGGIKTNQSAFSRFCSRVPLLGDWAHAMFAHNRILKTIPEEGDTPLIEAVLQAQRKELNRRGYLPAMLSCRRGMLAEDQERDHRKLYRQGLSVTAIWAGTDAIIPLRAIGLLGLWNRDARQEVVADAGHDLPITHPKDLASAIRAAMRD